MEGRVSISNTQHNSCGTAEPDTTSSWGREGREGRRGGKEGSGKHGRIVDNRVDRQLESTH